MSIKIIDETVKELKTLTLSQQMVVHDLVVSLKAKIPARRTSSANRHSYRRAQKAFSVFKGDLSKEIVEMRKDRI